MLRVSFAWPLALALLLSGCKHIPTEKERQSADIHYNLGIQAQQAGNIQEALSEYQKAVTLDPENADARNALGLVLHESFRRPVEAIEHYEKALELRPNFSEARTNLANVHLAQGRYDEAIKLYEQALNDMLYPTPFIAQGNMGWAYYKKGDTAKALENIRAAVTLNPGFCLGYKNLGLIHDQTGNTEEACRQFTRYREACPDVADAHMHEAVCLAKTGQVDAAREHFTTCETKATQPVLKDECRRLREHL
ncbi:social motility TPR repeat lipoprotein Tgl [Hyalangium rubrum]|uniref:Social motility TPR repeat lipoprotein Tgl n=1 Tax=Hyalangium rubrum TaxID=3103134 RepID=A0ABU5HBP6_9BACT|nr:social motility TPR repeat lipoprotein Tgl [Hyalangium sp. s54d21]MDY7230884.1 social motility TPR repeat lipoprotein Tgl [Hyalangium sp. s54d21]